MKTKHTPGPWEAPSAGIYAGDVQIAKITHRTANNGEDVMANARLIAAAPELLAALHFIVNDAEPGEDARLTVDGYNRACAAIEKATKGT